MKTAFTKILSLVLLLALVIGVLPACQTAQPGPGQDETTAPAQPSTEATASPETTVPAEPVDYAAAVTLNMGSGTAKQEVTVKTFVDGDTTHFYVPESVHEGGVMKVRYLAINTPESTGKIEEYGKAASRFTREKLSAATSIIIESETGSWDPDSTGSRFLAWVWYRTAEDQPYRNLNIEILQNGLAKANSTANNRYGSIAMQALDQAKAQKLSLYSGVPDPDFYYGEAMELTLRELRLNLPAYEGKKVAFNGIVTVDGNNSVYVEQQDPETGLYFGMAVYYGFNLPGPGLEILKVGNEVRIVGTVQYYEAGKTYQVSGLSYRMMKPDDPGNIQKISDGHQAAYVPTDAVTFVSGTVALETPEGSASYPYAELVMNSSIEMKQLRVTDVYTTNDQESASFGAMTLTCEADGQTVVIRTAVLLDDNGDLITEDTYLGRTIDVRGIVTCFDDVYQIKVYSPDAITIYD